MHPHRVEVLHAADRDRRVGGIAQHLELDLIPAQQAALDQDLADRARCQPRGQPVPSLVARRREAAPATAQGERRADDDRRPELRDEAQAGLDRLDHGALRHRLADAGHEVAEAAAILRRADRCQRGPEHADAAAIQHPGIVEGHGQVQPGLAPERRQQRVRAMLLDHAGQVFDGQRADHHRPAHVRIGHHGGRVRVHQDRLHALATQRQAGLHAGIVELGGLADDDRAGPDDEDASRPHAVACNNAASKTRAASIGPGAPSGWNCTDAIRPDAWTSPSTVPSFRSRWLTR